MIKYLLFIFLLFNCFIGISQEDKDVVIIEKRAKYKVDIYATNTSEINQRVHIQFSGEGYRKSGFKPVTTSIKPKDTVYLTTVYEMKKVNNYLSYKIIHLNKLDDKQKKLAQQKVKN
ncbi:hypothetical protein [Pseudofulvibacter geojedonensis]|uniref:Uncharacterized protein n=1 Tax=Pseudofulvibacter geojedonensis TaxID=1123758 RepID=A0ABW3HZN9_9FLAO